MRPDRADRLFALAAVLAAVVLLGLGAGLTFFSDEWAFIEHRSLGDLGTWFEPHNEHWATLPVVVYRLLVETIGLGSYMPYLTILIALHLLVATLVYTLVRRKSGPWPALAVGVVVLFFGSGFENLFWAFQIGFVGALAAGLAGILVFDARPLTARRAVAGAGLLVVALATQGGPGLVLCLAAGVELLLDAARRRMVVVLAIPGAVYATWYVAIGRVGVEAHQGLFSLGGVDDLPPAIFTGLGTATGALVGVGTVLGEIIVAASLVVMVALAVRRGRLHLSPRAVGCLVGAAALYGLIALARSFAGPDVVLYTRYTYVSAILLVVSLSAQLDRPNLRVPRIRLAWLAGAAVVLTLSLVWNVRLLFDGRAIFRDRAATTRAFVTVALQRPLPASTDPDRTLVTVPSPNALEQIVAAHGSPLSDALVPWAIAPLEPDRIAAARQILEEGAEIPLPEPQSP